MLPNAAPSSVSVTPRTYAGTMPLTDTEREMLAIESKWWRYAGAKEQAIRDRLDMSATQFYLKLNALIDTEAAMAHDPITSRRLRNLRTQRQRSRSVRRAG